MTTSMTDRAIAYAITAGLAPHTLCRAVAGAHEVVLDAHNGPDSPFGMLRIGPKTGKILRGSLHLGNDGPVVPIHNATEAHRALKTLANRRGIDTNDAH